jgi:small-conductance mechanosensitive channel
MNRLKTLQYCLLLLFVSSNLSGQQYEPGGEWVEIAGRKLFRIDQPFGTLTPLERALRVQEKLERIANDYGYSPDSIFIQHLDGYDRALCRDEMLFITADADTIGSGLTRTELAFMRVESTRKAIMDIRENRKPEVLLQQFGSGVVVISILIILLWLTNRLFKLLRRVLFRKSHSIGNFGFLKDNRFLRPKIVISGLIRLLRFFEMVLSFLLLYLSLPVLFRIFPATRSWGDQLVDLILFPLNKMYTGVIDYLPNLITIIIIGFVFHYLLKLLHFIAREIHQSRIEIPGFYSDWALPTYKLIRVPVYAFFFIIIFPYLPGSSSPAFQGVTVFLGLIISLGSSNAINNIMAGIVITYMRPFRIGDTISTGETTGQITEKTLLVTRIRSLKNEQITIPNANLLSNKIINYTQMAEKGELILYTSITIGYDAPWKTVHRLLLEAAANTLGLLKSPEPYVLQKALNDFYIEYQINAHCEASRGYDRIYSELHSQIQDAFNREGVEIMSPHFTSLRDGNSAAMPPDANVSDDDRGFKIKQDRV